MIISKMSKALLKECTLYYHLFSVIITEIFKADT